MKCSPRMLLRRAVGAGAQSSSSNLKVCFSEPFTNFTVRTFLLRCFLMAQDIPNTSAMLSGCYTICLRIQDEIANASPISGTTA